MAPVRKGGIIHFLDLGSGPMAGSGFRHAKQNREHNVVSVNRERSPLVLVNRQGRLIGQRHHRFVEADVFEFLKKTKPHSVEVVNDDFFLDEILLRRQKDVLEPAGNRAYELAPQIAEKIRQHIREYIGRVRHVLMPKGVLHVTLHGFYKNALVGELRLLGFEVTSERMLTRDEIFGGSSEAAKQALQNFDKIKAKYSPPGGLRILAPTLGYQSGVPTEILASVFIITAKSISAIRSRTS